MVDLGGHLTPEQRSQVAQIRKIGACHRCRWRRAKCDQGSPDDARCGPCRKAGWECIRNDGYSEWAATQNRSFSRLKCTFCRDAKVKCLPSDRDASQKCDRCIAKGLSCSDPQNARMQDLHALQPITRTFPIGWVNATKQNPQPVSSQDPKRPRSIQDVGYSLAGYVYKPIPSTHAFRVFELLPGDLSSSEIRIRLKLWDKSDPYETISYVWGQGPPSQSIIVEGLTQSSLGSIRVMPSLFSALQHLRRADRHRTLWVDAICIDQANMREKALQIQIMSTIMNQATNACVWLGEEHGTILASFATVQTLIRGLYRSMVRPTAGQLDAFVELLAHNYFSRRWCVQDLAQARRATLHCGVHSIPWDEFADAVTMFKALANRNDNNVSTVRTDDGYSFFTHDVHWLGATRLVEVLESIARVSKSGVVRLRLTLEELIDRLAYFKTTDPRDVVYALVPLAKDILPLQSTKLKMRGWDLAIHFAAPDFLARRAYAKWRNAVQNNRLKERSEESHSATRNYSSSYQGYLPVDYQKSYVEVCKDFVGFAITSSKSLDVLIRPWAPPHHTLPSWIATLDRAAFGPSRKSGRYERINADPLVKSPGQKVYHASAFTLPQCRYTDVDGVTKFAVQGFVLDVVNNIRPVAIGGNMHTSCMKFGGWANFKELPPDMLWRTLVADRGHEGLMPPVHYRRMCQIVFDGDSASAVLDTVRLLEMAPSWFIAEFLQRLQQVVWNKMLFKTKEHYFGLAPMTVEDDDLVCILYGCSVPVILRKMSSTHGGPFAPAAKYQIVGECFLQGYMDGEALLAQTSRGIADQFFELV